MSRAIGYVKEDENGNIQTDATGKAIRYGASDRLAIALLNRQKEAQATAPVVINIDFKSLGLSEPPEIEAEPLKQLPHIEGECEAVEQS